MNTTANMSVRIWNWEDHPAAPYPTSIPFKAWDLSEDAFYFQTSARLKPARTVVAVYFLNLQIWVGLTERVEYDWYTGARISATKEMLDRAERGYV